MRSTGFLLRRMVLLAYRRQLRLHHHVSWSARVLRRTFVSFFAPLTMNTLRTWSNHPECPYGCYIERTGSELRIGKQTNNFASIHIPSQLEETTPRLPMLHRDGTS